MKPRTPRYTPKIIKTARDHYVFGGLTFDEISEIEGMPSARSLRRWADDGSWNELCPSLNAETAIARRIVLLADRDNKDDADYKELDFLTKQQCALNQSRLPSAGITKKYGNTPAAAAAQHEQTSERTSKSKKRQKKIKNDVSSITKEMLDELKDNLLYPHQLHWFEHQDYRSRFILKPRQIGATFYFAFEAFYDAVVNGRNKIFISASRDQAEIFKANIIALCREQFGIELSGSPLMLRNKGKTTTLYFKSTNARTAQSASGDLYIDEVFWIPKFKELRSLAQAMATHKDFRITYFSTPSVTSHEAYDLWNGRWYRKTKACNDPEFAIDVSHKTLKHGLLCDDGIWRQKLNVYDVVEQGFDRIDISMLENEYSKEEFDNLFMCKFIDDAHSAFSLKQLMACVGNSKKWTDFDPTWSRPYAMKPVVIGFDPARTRDIASVVVLSLPLGPDDKFRLLESLNLSGNDFETMASEIKELTLKYHVVHIGVDTTGMGLGVFELIQKFFPLAMPIHYNPHNKNKMVIKSLNVIGKKRFEYDENSVMVASSFINIRKKVVGDQISYATNRTAATGHADIAWAIMHAMIYEPLSGDSSSTRTSIGLDAA
ncbi:terminase large subunit domain-containing protein [Moritella yayanosii]|uniref:Putative bacteriophage terminase, ATPase subunit n=1 Tax=Moritella yayanosii TaxID=69539 RepID=A0A330LN11_9GAMM|nr:terminase family protein [Moritella yayanosii]SQD77832.1 putative bacteriophage terminase, ATPase subunit [Moritella yayanosii]